MATLNRLVTVFSANTTSFTAGTKKMSASMAAFRANVLASGKAINASLNRIGLAAGIAGGLMVKHYAEFERRMVTVGAILGKNRVEMELLTDAAKRMGRTTIFTATQAAEAQQVMAMAGLNQKEILLALGPALQLASVGEVEIAEAAEIAAKTMRGMNLSAGDLYRVNNVLAGALVSSTTNMTQLGNALKYVAPLAAATNTTIENTVAMIGKLSSAGFQGEMAGTGLRQAMAKLAGSTPHATKVLRDYGIVTLDASSNMLPMFDILHQMEQQALSAGQVFEIFGARAGPQMLALLSVGVEGLEAYSEELKEANRVGKAAQIEQQKLDTIWGAWKLMISAVSGVIIDASEDIATVIRDVQAGFTELFDNLDSRARIIEILSHFMRAFIGTLQSLMMWLNENYVAVMDFVGALGAIMAWFFDFLATYPQVMAGLLALKVAGFMGLTNVVLTLGRTLKTLVNLIFPNLVSELGLLKLRFQLLTHNVRAFHLVLGGLAVGAIVVGLGAIKMAQMEINNEYERGIRLLERLQRLQMKSIDKDTRAALKIKDSQKQWEALNEVKKKVELTTKNTETSIAAEIKEIQRATNELEGMRDAIEAGIAVQSPGDPEFIKDLKTFAVTELMEMTRGMGIQGLDAQADLVAEIKSRKEQVKSYKDALDQTKRREEDIISLMEQADARLDATAAAGGGPGGAGGGAGGAGGGFGGGGAGGGFGGPVGDAAKAIADRIEDSRRTEEREKFGRPAAREGAELEKFLDLGPAKDELLSFMDTLDGLTASEAAMLADVRSLLVESAHVHGMSQAEIDEEFRQQAMARLQAHHQAIAEAEKIKDLQEVQKKAGSLQEQLAADPLSETGGHGPMERIKQEMDLLTLALDTGMISAQGYSQELAKIQTAYSTGASVASRLASVQYTQADSAKIAANTMVSFEKQFEQLQADFMSGALNTSQYKFAIQALGQAMRESTQAAKAEEAAEKAAAAARRRKIAAASKPKGGGRVGGGGSGGPTGPAHPMDTLLARLSMAQAKAQLLAPNKAMFGRNIAGSRIGDIRKRRQSFAQAMGDVQHVQRMIAQMRMSAMAGPMMAMQSRRGAFGQMGGDPGIVSQGNITIELPNVTRVNNEDIGELADRLEDEQRRRGRRVV